MDCAWTAEEEMAFSLENQRLISEEIDKRIKEALNPLSRTKRLLRGLKDWGLTALIWTAPLSLLAISITLGVRVVSDIKEESTFRANSGTSFKSIDEHLKKLDDGLSRINTKLDLRDQSGLNIQNFNRALPAVAASIKSANNLGIPTPEDVQHPLQKQLQSADPHAPGYWDAVAQFVSYRSQQEAPTSLRTALLGVSLPRCMGQGRVAPLDKDLHQLAPNVWERCVVYLDDRFMGNGTAPHAQLGDLVFKECLVVYKGGPVDGFVTYALFQDCIFAFSPDAAPSKRGEFVSQFLLKTLPAKSIKIPPAVANF